MNFRKLKTTLLAGAAVLAMSSGAMALTFGNIPGGVAGSNDGLSPLGLSDPLNGWYGAELFLSGGPATITATILGSEAGNNNSFTFGGNTYQTGGGTNNWTGDNSAGGGITTWNLGNVGSGSLSFSFGTSGGLSVANGSNPDNTQPAPNPGINFFASFVENQNAGSGQGVYLFFDDDGAANDDNHDDLVVRLDITGGPGRITVVPLPAGGLLLISALGGMAVLRRRRNKAA